MTSNAKTVKQDHGMVDRDEINEVLRTYIVFMPEAVGQDTES